MALPPGTAGYTIEGARTGGLTVLLLVLLATATIDSGAFTTASVARPGAADVVDDAGGPVSLVDGNSGDAVGYTPGGELTVDVTRLGSAAGVSPSATYEFGDPGDPAGERAFDLVNRDTAVHRIRLGYALSAGSADGDPDANVEFRVYRPSGAPAAVASEEGGAVTFEIGAGETYHVVVVVDTHGLTPNADLSGTLEATVT